jgi:hypothetical protein
MKQQQPLAALTHSHATNSLIPTRVASKEFQVSQGAVSRGWQLELGRKRMLQMDELDSNSGLNHWLHLSLEWQAIESLEIV